MLDKTLHKELNECFLLHGTAASSVDAIAQLGFDVRLSHDSALYGRGIYLAESMNKAFVYTGEYCLVIERRPSFLMCTASVIHLVPLSDSPSRYQMD